jgi:toxin ParE1/3/4
MPKCVLDSCVEDELWDIWKFIAEDNPDAATRVIEAVQTTFQKLAVNPGLGTPRRFRNLRLRDIRSLPVIGFKNYLIFYRCIPDGIQVHHVYHGARDLESLFDDKR